MTNPETGQPLGKAPRFFYGYIVVVLALLIMLIVYGTRTSFGVFFKPLLGEFGWTRASISGAMTLSLITQGAWGVIMGRLTDKVGPRLVITLCCFLSGLGFLLMSQVNSLWQIYVYYGVIIGFGMGGVFVGLLATVSRWFVKRRGTMMGIVLTGLGASILIVSPVATWLISVFDWRYAYVIMGGVVLVMGVVLAQFLRRDPAAMGLQPYGQREMAGQLLASRARGLSLREALHTWQFWLILPIFAGVGYSVFAFVTHLIAHLTDLGITAAMAANAFALHGGASVIGGLVLGVIADRVGMRQVLAISCILMMAAFLLLIPCTNLWAFFVAALIFGLGGGGAGVAEPALVAELFGMKSHGLIFGVVSVAFTLGGAVGPLVTGYIFDITGNYQLAFLVCAATGVLGFILATILRPIKGLDSV